MDPRVHGPTNIRVPDAGPCAARGGDGAPDEKAQKRANRQSARRRPGHALAIDAARPAIQQASKDATGAPAASGHTRE